MLFKKEKKVKQDLNLSFELTLPEKLIYDQVPTLSAGYLCLKIDKIYYISELNYGLNNPIFIRVGEQRSEDEALVIYCRSKNNNSQGLPLLNINSYKLLLLQHIVPIESAKNMIMIMNSPTKTRGSIVQGEHFAKKINLPEIPTDVFSTALSKILIKIQMQENLNYDLTFENTANSSRYEF